MLNRLGLLVKPKTLAWAFLDRGKDVKNVRRAQDSSLVRFVGRLAPSPSALPLDLARRKTRHCIAATELDLTAPDRSARAMGIPESPHLLAKCPDLPGGEFVG